jgi:hypothetical protein
MVVRACANPWQLLRPLWIFAQTRHHRPDCLPWDKPPQQPPQQRRIALTRVHRPSLDASEQADVTERDCSRLLQSRKRSMSLEDHQGSVRSNPSLSYIQTRSSSSVVRPSSSQSNARPSPDWYGYRMVTSANKPLDADMKALSRSVSRLGSGSVRGEHELNYSRSNQTSSKTTISDVSGSIVSRARGISHTSTAATSPDTGESIGVESPVVSALSHKLLHQLSSEHICFRGVILFIKGQT